MVDPEHSRQQTTTHNTYSSQSSSQEVKPKVHTEGSKISPEDPRAIMGNKSKPLQKKKVPKERLAVSPSRSEDTPVVKAESSEQQMSLPKQHSANSEDVAFVEQHRPAPANVIETSTQDSGEEIMEESTGEPRSCLPVLYIGNAN